MASKLFTFKTHKSQGSQWPNCFVMLPKEAEKMIDQILLHSASTRTSERVIEKALLTGSIALKRKTFMRARLVLASNVSSDQACIW